MAHSWKKKTAEDHVETRFAEVEGSKVEIKEYVRDTKLNNIKPSQAYKVHGAHIYVDITNFEDLLGTDDEADHKKTLRFLNLHYRAVARVLRECGVIRVDFHNQRLHAVVTKPYGEDQEGDRVHKAVAVGKLIADVLSETGDDDADIPDAKVRIGIDTGMALAVNNGRKGDREPLFLGDAANQAAKYASGHKGAGVYLTGTAREHAGYDKVASPKTTKLSAAEIESSQEKASLPVTADAVVRKWRKELEDHPVEAVDFTRTTPPLSNLKFDDLSPKNSRRQEVVSVYADLDEFTAYVEKHLADRPEDVVRVLHVVRAELARCIHNDFGGRRVRFIGDCLHGVLCEGTAHITDEEETVSTATLCAGAMRSSFKVAIDYLRDQSVDVDGLDLQIGFEIGTAVLTRLGLSGDRLRCAAGKSVIGAEAEQSACAASDTRIGKAAYDASTSAVQDLFTAKRVVDGLTYNEAVTALAEKGDATAKAALDEANAKVSPQVAAATIAPIKPYVH